MTDRTAETRFWFQPTDEQIDGAAQWLTTRPPNIRVLAARFLPWTLWRLDPPGQNVYVISFGEWLDGSVSLTVAVTQELNPDLMLLFDREVFGVDSSRLKPIPEPYKQ